MPYYCRIEILGQKYTQVTQQRTFYAKLLFTIIIRYSGVKLFRLSRLFKTKLRHISTPQTVRV